ncbi:MAG: hypothetical protein IPK77_00030 [Cellvibrio sp.]|nr:hypothetical protein [Cellvibrio sp.]
MSNEWGNVLKQSLRDLSPKRYGCWNEIPAFYFDHLIQQKEIQIISRLMHQLNHIFYIQWFELLKSLNSGSIDVRLITSYCGDEEIFQTSLPHFAKSCHPSVRLSVASHSQTTPEILRDLCVDPDPKIAKAASEHKNLPKDAIFIIEDREADRFGQQLDQLDTLKWNDLGEFLLHPDFPSEALDTLSKREDDAIMFACTMHPNASEQLRQKVLDSNKNWKKAAVALNPNTPESILRDLIKIQDYDIAFALASNCSLPEDLQLQLANHPERSIRLHMADQTLSMKVWSEVSKHPAPEYLHTPLEKFLALVLDPKAKKYNIDNLYRDINYDRSEGGVLATCIVHALALHPKLPKEFLAEFLRYLPWLKQHNKTVQMMMLEGQSLPSCDAYEEFWSSEEKLSKYPAHLANAFLKSKDPKIVRMASSHPWCNKSLLIPLWFSSDKPTLKRLAQRTDMPRCFYEVLCRTGDESTKLVLKENSATKLRGAEISSIEPVSEKLLVPEIVTKNGILSIKGNQKERIKLAESTDDEQVLLTLINDKLPIVKNAVIYRESLPFNIIKALLLDSDQNIRLKMIVHLTQHSNEVSIEIERQLCCEGGEIASRLASYTRHEEIQLSLVKTYSERLFSNEHITTNTSQQLFKYGELTHLSWLKDKMPDPRKFVHQLLELYLAIYSETGKSSLPGFDYFCTIFPDTGRKSYEVKYTKLIANKNYLSELRSEIVRLIKEYDDDIFQNIAKTFIEEHASSLYNISELLGYSRYISARNMETILNGSVKLRISIATNPYLNTDAIDRLKIDTEESIRIALMQSHPDLEEYFVGDPSVALREELAKKTSNPSIQRLLLNDIERSVFSCLACNKSCDLALVTELLSKNPMPFAKYFLIGEEDTPTSILELLMKDRVPGVRNDANKALHNRNQNR